MDGTLEDSGDLPFPAELMPAAAQNANGWIYAIDPSYDPDGRVPPEAIAGAWKIGPDGRPTGEFRRNANFKPGNPGCGERTTK